MKKSKSERLFELLNEIDDDILEEALQADTKTKLKLAVSKTKIII